METDIFGLILIKMDSKNEFIQKYQEYFVGDPSDTMDWGSDRQI